MKIAQNRQPSTEFEPVVLYGVPRKTYRAVLDAIGTNCVQPAYNRGTLEIHRQLYEVSPEAYVKLLDASPGINLRHTFDQGFLEITGPPEKHYWVAILVARMVQAYALASNTPIQSVGRMTLQSADGRCGLQADETYYLAHESLMRCKDTYDPGQDPPPDLALEIDIRNTSVPRLPVFAKIGVPEVWRVRKCGQLRFYKLAKGKYKQIDHSAAFPFAAPADFMRCADRGKEIGENGVVRAFLHWAETASRQP